MNRLPWRHYARLTDANVVHLVVPEDVDYGLGGAFPGLTPVCRRSSLSVGDVIPMWALAGESLPEAAMRLPLCQNCVTELGKRRDDESG